MTDYEEHELGSFSMMDLFRSEMDTHAAALNNGLLALENDPLAVKSHIDSLMRAAHSIKGGARIVDLDAAVNIAHTLEDCFISIQKNDIKLSSAQLDILFKGVDTLIKISETAENQDELEHIIADTDTLISAISNISRSKEPCPHVPLTDNSIIEAQKQPELEEIDEPPLIENIIQEPDEPVQKKENTSPKTDTGLEKERMVRVTASKIERLMGLAGEVVVSAKWLPPFINSLMTLKRSQSDLSNTLDELQREIIKKKDSSRSLHLALQAREKIRLCNIQMADRLNQMDMFSNLSETLADRLYHEVIGVKMCPFSNGTAKLPRMVRDLARSLNKKARLEIIGESIEIDRDILEKLDAPINHIIRNAIDHGIETPEIRTSSGKPETGTIRIEVFHLAGMLMIIISDDGRGIYLDKLSQQILERGHTTPDLIKNMSERELMDFLFLPGFSTVSKVTEISGRGVGLDVVNNVVHEVGGRVRAKSYPGQGLSFHLELPLTLSVIRTFLVEIAGEPYAFPLARINRCVKLEKKDIKIVEDRQYFCTDTENIALIDIHEVLEIKASGTQNDIMNVVIVSDKEFSYGLVADKFLGECDLVVRPLDSRLGKIPNISAAAVMLDGSPVLIFDVEDLINSIAGLLTGKRRLSRIENSIKEQDRDKPKRILVVDDSFIVREKERKLLVNKGYDVETAVDGQDGWNLLRTLDFDMVLTDIDMPRMNGFELIRNIKQNDKLKSMPVIIVSYKASDDDRFQGLKAGANYYLTKTNFDDNSLIDAVIDLIGEAKAGD
ncbi:Two component system response regulator/histidine kinase CheA-like, Hpt and CheW-like domains-containing [Desulfonema limicola]|uniref:histidine kinase n=1 Tax=Desulfonema limicola TaxID=45656 RepID=A0A975BEL8_9BACT|nr:hybrid sensor histidine kinase/response regulator [Desulfonema limicola]QTA83946.1 Two component system response regulator/histidine kinase CheA-like, Hpt and CheW-like domains-containing [Desulfonema limicola]